MTELLKKIKQMIGPKAEEPMWSLSQHDILPLLVQGHRNRTEAEGIARFLRHFLTMDDIFGCGDYIKERLSEMLDDTWTTAEFLRTMHESVSRDASEITQLWTMQRQGGQYVLFYDEYSCCMVSSEEAEIQSVFSTDISGTLTECLKEIIRRIGGAA